MKHARCQRPKCPYCKGTGHVPDNAAIGAEMRAKRLKAGKLAQNVAKYMGITGAHLSNMEQGKRGWSIAMQTRFELALRQ